MSPETFYVCGPPGTGLRKTHYLSGQCERAVDKHGRDGVAIASLTRAAAAEIASRTEVEDHLVGTLHAHAFRALDQPRLAETPEGIKLWNEAHPHAALGRGSNRLEDATGDLGSDGAGDDVHGQVMRLRAAMVPRSAWTVAQTEHDALWTDFKAQTGRLDFTDLIERCAAGGAHYARPRVLLVDEAQDLSRLELELVKTWGAGAGTTVLAGDADQAIFSWRGADPRALMGMDFTGRRVLAQSHRVPRAVHALAMAWIRGIEDRDDVDYHPTAVEGEASVADFGLRETGDVCQLAESYAAAGRTVMVLASCGYMLGGVLRALKERGTPFWNPYAADRGQFNPMRGAGRLKAFLAADERVWGAEARCWTWDDLRRWTDPLTSKGVLVRGAKTYIEAKCTENRFNETRAHDEVPLDEVLGLLDGGSINHPALHMDVEWWASCVRAKERAAEEYPLQVWRSQGAGALGAEPRVIVGTGHSVKGGEADAVLICPDNSNVGHAQWRAGGDGRDAIRRLFYVACTRAREEVVLLAPSAMGGEHVSSELRAALGEARVAA